MTKRYGKNEEVAQAFAQGETEGETKHMFIEKRAIYSYGWHFPIALKLLDGKVLFNKDGYSQSTSRHKNLVKNALAGFGAFIFTSTNKLKEFIERDVKTMNDLIAEEL